MLLEISVRGQLRLVLGQTKVLLLLVYLVNNLVNILITFCLSLSYCCGSSVTVGYRRVKVDVTFDITITRVEFLSTSFVCFDFQISSVGVCEPKNTNSGGNFEMWKA